MIPDRERRLHGRDLRVREHQAVDQTNISCPICLQQGFILDFSELLVSVDLPVGVNVRVTRTIAESSVLNSTVTMAWSEPWRTARAALRPVGWPSSAQRVASTREDLPTPFGATKNTTAASRPIVTSS